MKKRLPESLINRKFERWLVIEDKLERKVLCRCDCSNEKFIDRYSLLSKKSKSCGCLSRERSRERTKTHGESTGKKQRLYRIWSCMKHSCVGEKSPYYKNYGGRGIEVCDEWNSSYETFKKWALENGYTDELTIDRIDNDGNYEPKNCRWVTKQFQDTNKRNNIYFYVDGEKITMKELSRRTGIPDNTLHHRYHKLGKTTYEEIIKPIKRNKIV